MLFSPPPPPISLSNLSSLNRAVSHLSFSFPSMPLSLHSKDSTGKRVNVPPTRHSAARRYKSSKSGLTSPSVDPITPSAWHRSSWSNNCSATGMTQPGKPGIDPPVSCSRSSRWPSGYGVHLESGRSRVRIPLAPRFVRGRVIPVT